MNYRGALSGNFNHYRSDWMQPRNTASITSASFTKEFDFTFSLGRPTNRREVGNLLCKCGAFESYKELSEKLTFIAINNNSTENGQVLIQCGDKILADDVVDKLNDMDNTPVKRCHSYNIKEVPVKFHHIHPSVNIQRDVVDGFLTKFGKVKSWHAQIDPVFKLLTGQCIFVMFEDDLKKNPLPTTVFINGVPTAVSYRTRVKTCFLCGKDDHFKTNCPNKENSVQKCWQCGEDGHIKRDCPKGGFNASSVVNELPNREEDPILPSPHASNFNPFLPGPQAIQNKKQETSVSSVSVPDQVAPTDAQVAPPTDVQEAPPTDDQEAPSHEEKENENAVEVSDEGSSNDEEDVHSDATAVTEEQ